MAATGYEINIRQDKRTGEYLAVYPGAYRSRQGDRYYLGHAMADWFLELSPEYLTKATKPVKRDDPNFPEDLKRAVDRHTGYIMIVVDRLYSR